MRPIYVLHVDKNAKLYDYCKLFTYRLVVLQIQASVSKQHE